MLRPAVLGLLLACAATLCSSAVVPEQTVSLLFAQTAGDLNEFPKQGETVVVNPWHYLHRMSMNRLMIASTAPFMGSMGPNPSDGCMWGLPMQLSWLLNSGRLADPTGQTTCGVETEDRMCISPNSWWACQNYFVSAIPFLCAAEQGMLGAGVMVQMENPDGFEEYCTTYADCSAKYPEVVAKWDAFYQGLKASVDSTLPDNEKKDALLGLFWDGQMTSMRTAAVCKAKQSSYSPVETSFANNWMVSAEYVAGARFHFNLDNAVMFAAPMPTRLLKEGDNPPDIADLTTEENHTLTTFSWINSINNALGGTLVNLWHRAMCSVSTREKGRDMMSQLMLNPAFATNTFVSIITEMVINC
ncbi:protein LEG1 homolog [Salarias fasciatus]|uniref:protein LEG1 homolog n=1 Tax=Salarias fasciatus TaxID=181472 RepID=UPI001176E472|nr:protein LEG1 homolog [Salarias fasciatus]